MKIHPTAIISEKAKLSEDVEVGPYVLIEEDVQIGRRVKIYSHAHILKHTTIGDDCQVHMGAVLGHVPQLRRNPSEDGRLVIGQRNIFREYATVHRSNQPTPATIIGDDNYFMGFSHIAHDCIIGNHVTVCNGTLIAGHVVVEDYSFISGNVTVHQFCRIGKLSMVAGLARVAKDVPPYMLIKGDSAVWAINSVGLRRANLSLKSRSEIKAAFKLLYKSGLNVKQAIEQLQRQDSSCEIKHLINFILHSERGICAHKSSSLWERLRFSSSGLRPRRIPAYQLFKKIAFGNNPKQFSSSASRRTRTILTKRRISKWYSIYTFLYHKKNRKGQEPVALALLFVLTILLLLFFSRPIREKLQDNYRQLIQKAQDSFPDRDTFFQ